MSMRAQAVVAIEPCRVAFQSVEVPDPVGYNVGMRAELAAGDRAVVIGDGMVGQWAAQTLKFRGARVLLGRHDERLAKFSVGIDCVGAKASVEWLMDNDARRKGAAMRRIRKMTRGRVWPGAMTLLTLCAGGMCRAEVTAYPAPPATEIKRNADFTRVEVRTDGRGMWQEVAVYDHESSFAGHAGIAAFGMTSPAEVRVTFKTPVTAAAVLPSRRKIQTRLSGSQISFTVPKAQNLIVNVNGDKDHPLCLFANPADKNPPKPDAPDVDYYAPGTMTQYRKTAKKHIYIAGGAVVKGAIDLTSGTTLDGFGMLYTDVNTNPLKSWQADNITVRGVIVYNFGPGLWKQDCLPQLARSDQQWNGRFECVLSLST